jgi:hypothetical protein
MPGLRALAAYYRSRTAGAGAASPHRRPTRQAILALRRPCHATVPPRPPSTALLLERDPGDGVHYAKTVPMPPGICCGAPVAATIGILELKGFLPSVRPGNLRLPSSATSQARLTWPQKNTRAPRTRSADTSWHWHQRDAFRSAHGGYVHCDLPRCHSARRCLRRRMQ